MRKLGFIVAVFSAFSISVCTSNAQFFSVASALGFPGGASPSGIPPDDVLFPGPAPAIPGAGPLGPGFIDVNAICFGYILPAFGSPLVAHYEFGLSALTPPGAGTGAVGTEFGGDHIADIFSSDGMGSNLLLWDGDGLATSNAPLAGVLGLPEPFDDTDAWDNSIFPSYHGGIFFSVDTFSAITFYGGAASSADVLFGPAGAGYDIPAGPVPSPPAAAAYVVAGLLGLDLAGPLTDDIDALVVIDDGDFIWGAGPGIDTILFSLTPGSMAFTTPSPYTGLGPEDILIADSAGIAGLFLPGIALGVAPGIADINALDIKIRQESPQIAADTNGSIHVTWDFLVPPFSYTVQVANASAPYFGWTDYATFSSSGPFYTMIDTNAAMSNLLYRTKQQPW